MSPPNSDTVVLKIAVDLIETTNSVEVSSPISDTAFLREGDTVALHNKNMNDRIRIHDIDAPANIYPRPHRDSSRDNTGLAPCGRPADRPRPAPVEIQYGGESQGRPEGGWWDRLRR